jgi:hypothetical protein
MHNKLSASYNAFDAIDLIEESIIRIRDHVDFISVVFQFVSNRGAKCNDADVDYLISLKEKGLIDSLNKYSPKLNVHPHINEIAKRNLGLQLAMNAQCTHHMTIDCDEYYIPAEFEKARNIIYADKIGSSALQMLTYYGDKNHVIDPPETYWCPFISKIQYGYSIYRLAAAYPCYCDPTRKMVPFEGNFCQFDRSLIQMHHLSYIRNDNLQSKLANSSARTAWQKETVDDVIEHYQNWNPSILNGKFPSPVGTTIHPLKYVELL